MNELPTEAPYSTRTGYVVGSRYSPDVGEHAGHVVRIVSTDTRLTDTPLATERQVRHVLARCETCLESWTFSGEVE